MGEQFRIIGIKPIRPSFHDYKDPNYEKIERIHKALWNINEWLYFYQGFCINEIEKKVTANSESIKSLSIYDTETLKVSVCAIVGKNGKGKSSLVDLLIRIINNLSAVLMGEGFNFAAAEHLHYIDHVYAALAFQIGPRIYILEVQGRKMKLKKYQRRRNTGYNFVSTGDDEILLDGSLNDQYKLLPKLSNGRRILKTLFYSMICNYSLYGFNYREYADEYTPIKRIQQLGKKNINPTDEDRSWLTGIFHKNDGYQTPIVLHPMRHNGMLDINKENHLASERMAALLFYQDIDGKYPFRNINDLEVVAIKLITSESNRYCREHMLETLNIGKGRNINKYFSQVYESILGFWDDKYNILSTSVNKPHRNDALDYIVYKTLKIIANYKKYTPILNYISKSQYDLQKLKDKLEPLYLDFSHVTKKLLQTINYLRYDIYHINEKFVTLKSIDDKLIPFFELQEKKGKHRMLKATLLPPPIFDTEMELCHRGKNESIPFNRLSSGERQFAYTISNFLYHLVNIDSAWNDYYHDKNHADVIKYHYVNIVFDEVELYFHPDMQRKFMSSLMASLRSVHFSSNLRGINIILATHSPFILSDIPTSNVLCLGTDKHTTQSSFGANIITLLADGFFMDSTFGEYSRSFVSDIADTYYKLQNHDDVIQYYIDHRKRFKYVQKNIGDPILKGIIDKMMIDLEKAYKMFRKEL